MAEFNEEDYHRRGERAPELVWVIPNDTGEYVRKYEIFDQRTGGPYAVKKWVNGTYVGWVKYPETEFDTVSGANYAILMDLEA